MRNALLSLSLLICACSESPNRTEFTNEQLALLQLHERVGALSAQLGVRPAMPDLAPLSDRVAALEARATAMEAAMAKLPARQPEMHLWDAVNNVDLGRWLGGTTTYSEKYQSPIDWTNPHSVYYASDDCTGDEVCIPGLDGGAFPGMHVLSISDGAILITGRAQVTCHSIPNGPGKCIQANNSADAYGLVTRDGATYVKPSSIAFVTR